MPWKSKAQQAWGNSPSGHKALGDAGIAEFNAASKGKKMPSKLKGEAHSYDASRAMRPVVSRYSK